MKKILFRKTTEYNLGKELPDKQRFAYLVDIGTQTIDPKPISYFNIPKNVEYIYGSTLLRVKNSIIQNDTPISFEAGLNEVLFDISKMVSFNDFILHGSSLIRSRFKAFFIKNMLVETNSEIFKQIEDMLRKIKKHEGETLLVVSHSFKLKLIQAYISTQGQIVDKPELIHDYIFDNKKTFNFEEGFDVEYGELSFLE